MQLCKAVKTQSFTQDIFLSKSHPSPVLKKKKPKNKTITRPTNLGNSPDLQLNL